MTAEELNEILKATKANRPQVTQTMNFYAPIGQQIAHVDKIEAHFDKDSQMQVANVEGTEIAQMDDFNASAQQAIAEIGNELLPIFGNDLQEVQQFLNTIKGADNTMITSTVKKLASQGIINERAKNSKLYNILKRHGIYNAGQSTWNKQV